MFSLHALTSQSSDIIFPFTPQQIAFNQKNDKVLSETFLWLESGLPENHHLYDIELKYLAEMLPLITVHNNILFIQLQHDHKIDIIFENKYKILIPLSLRDEVIKSCHDHKLHGHFKEVTTFHRIASKFYWRTMRSDIATYIAKCIPCNLGSN